MAGDVEKGTKLLEAIDNKQFTDALTLIAEGADVNIPYNGTFALHMAIEHGSQGVVEALVSAGADLMAQDFHGFHAFARACRSHQKGIAGFLLRNGADINAPIDEEGRTVLHMLFWCPAVISMVEFLLDFEELNVNAQDHNGQTPLHFAAKLDTTIHKDCVHRAKSLLERDALPNISDNQGMTPLHLAAKTGNTGMIWLLWSHDAKMEARNEKLETPLHLAAASEHFSGLDCLLLHSKDVNATTVDLNTPLHYAVRKNRLSIIKILCMFSKNPINLNVKNAFGRTALYMAARDRKTDIVRYLLDEFGRSGILVNDIGEQSLLDFYKNDTKMQCFLTRHGIVPKDPQAVVESVSVVELSEKPKKGVSFAQGTNFETGGAAQKRQPELDLMIERAGFQQEDIKCDYRVTRPHGLRQARLVVLANRQTNIAAPAMHVTIEHQPSTTLPKNASEGEMEVTRPKSPPLLVSEQGQQLNGLQAASAASEVMTMLECGEQVPVTGKPSF